METNLYTLIKDRAKGLPEKKVRNVMYQLIQGLGDMHKHGSAPDAGGGFREFGLFISSRVSCAVG